MLDNKDKPQTKTVSVDGFHGFGNPLDTNGEPTKHRKKQLPVKYYISNFENDPNDDCPELVQFTATTTQYDIMVSAILPAHHCDLIYVVANAMINAKLSAKGYHADNIELVDVDVDAGENKDSDL